MRFEDCTPAERGAIAARETACFFCGTCDDRRVIIKERGRIVLLCDGCGPHLSSNEIFLISERLQ